MKTARTRNVSDCLSSLYAWFYLYSLGVTTGSFFEVIFRTTQSNSIKTTAKRLNLIAMLLEVLHLSAKYTRDAVDEKTINSPGQVAVSYTHLTLPTNREV